MTVQANEPSDTRVVVVDDTPDLRELLCLALMRSGDFTVVAEAGNGREAIEVVRRVRPDLVLLDLAMPVMDGLEALPVIRELCPDAKIVVLSGFGASAMAQRALATGADSYLQKGTPLAVVLDHIRTLTGKTTPSRSLRVARHERHSPAAEPAAESVRPTMLVPVPDPESAPVDAAPSAYDARPSTPAALDIAPIGVIEVLDQPHFAITYANAAAARLLGVEVTEGMQLAIAVPRLAELVGYHRLSDDVTFELPMGDPARRTTCLLRRSAETLCLYLRSREADSAADMLRRAIATAAHEVRNPVAVLTGVAETMEEHGDDLSTEQRLRLMASVARQARLLDSLTADLLTAAQAQRGTLRVDLERVDARAVVEAVVADGYGATVEAQAPAVVLADPLRLEQMLSNLLSNAVKYGEPPIEVRVRSSNGWVLIEVSDNGDGVTDDFRPQLFQEFARARGTQARGTGLGLYVVRSLAEAQHGSVSYAPRPGGGAIFRLSLPSAL